MQTFASIDPSLAQECFIYDQHSGFLTWRVRPGQKMKARNTRWAGKIAGHEHTCTVGKKYIQVRVNNAMHYAHRIAWVMMHGPIPPGMQVDHINGDGTDNRAANLRLVSSSGNKKNQRRMKSNTSGFTGVYRSGRKWAARVWTKEKFITLGYAETPEAAYLIRMAYNEAHGFHRNHGADRPL
jgi:hypothetical protein